MSTTTEVRALTAEELAEIELPEFSRTYVKPQPKYKDGAIKDANGNALTGREFSASGPKADRVVKYVMHGGYTRQEIASFVGCSVSRVGEVLWAMDAAGVKYPELVRRRSDAKPVEVVVTEEAASVTETEGTEPEVTEGVTDEQVREEIAAEFTHNLNEDDESESA